MEVVGAAEFSEEEIDRAALEHVSRPRVSVGDTTLGVDYGSGSFWDALQDFMAEPELQELTHTFAPMAADPEVAAQRRWQLRLIHAFGYLLQASADHTIAGEWRPEDYELANIVGSALNPDEKRHAAAMRAFEDWYCQEQERRMESARQHAPAWLTWRRDNAKRTGR